MNRQQRRQAARQARARAENRAQQQANDDYISSRLDSTYLEQSYTAVALALRKLYGFGQMRVARVWQEMNDIFNSMGGSADEYERLRKQVKDELDLVISWTKE